MTCLTGIVTKLGTIGDGPKLFVHGLRAGGGATDRARRCGGVNALIESEGARVEAFEGAMDHVGFSGLDRILAVDRL